MPVRFFITEKIYQRWWFMSTEEFFTTALQEPGFKNTESTEKTIFK